MRNVSLVLVLTAVTVAMGCGTPGKGASSEEWRLTSLERAFQEKEERERAQRAEMETRYAALENRVAGLESAWDAQGFPSERRKAPDKGLEVKLSPRPLEESDIAEQEAVKESLNNPATPPVSESQTGPVHAALSEAPSTEGDGSAEPSSDPISLYEKALDLTRKGEVAQGRELFQQFLEKYPENSYVPNALYWLGETYYREGNYPQAILAFKDVPARFAQHDKAPAALLKMGYSYESLGDLDNARFYLRNLLEVYPTSEPGKLAQRRLQTLGP